ncbi:hypothetical protein SCACP_24990 [Sporomusa carbonis]|uniref:pilus assembly protein TadG-related protein n=1 Tax=Sporomusa carbonis TaxID=3076075 RepID=UPI003A719A1B
MDLYNKLKCEKGQVLILVAFMLPVLLVFCALVIDVGMMYVEKTRISDMADAAALAGIYELPGNPADATARAAAKATAIQYATLNGLQESDLP